MARMGITDLMQAFVTGEDVDGMRVSSLSVRGNTLYSYAYPLAYFGRDINGNTTVFINTARTGERVGDKPTCWNMQNQHAASRDTAYSVTTSRQRSKVAYLASMANRNVIYCDFGEMTIEARNTVYVPDYAITAD